MSNPEKKEKKNKYYYAVKCGFKPGIYTKWDECKEQVNGFPKPVYKKFDTEEDAKATVASYELKFKNGNSPYDSPYYYELPELNKWIVKNKSTGKALKNIKYKEVSFGVYNI